MARVVIILCVLLSLFKKQFSLPQTIEIPKTVLDGIEQLFDLKGERVMDIAGLMIGSYIDTTVDPCNDFFKYACGKWKTFNSREDRATSVSQVMQYYVNNKMLNILKKPKSFKDPNDIGQKIKTYFDSCIDEKIIKHRGLAPIHEYLPSLGGCPSMDYTKCNVEEVDWLALAANIKRHNEDYVIGSYVGADFWDTTHNIVIFGEPYLTFGSAISYKDINYRNTMFRILLSLYGQMTGSTKNAAQYLNFEIMLANISINSVEQKHSSDVYERYTVSQMHEKFPGIDWRRYLTIIRGEAVSDSEYVGMVATEYYSNLSNMLQKQQSKRDIVNYLMGRFAHFLVKHFTTDYIYTNKSRWNLTCTEKVMKYLDLPTSYIFGKVFMKKNRRKDAIRMTEEFKDILENIFKESSWLDPATKARALLKLENVKLKALGVEKRYQNRTYLSDLYSDVTVQAGRYFENSMSVLKSYAQREQDEIDNIVLYSPTPSTTTVNAQLDISTNRIFVGAGSLIPPFYHPKYSKFHKYGVLGFLIAHEITHAFDNFGHKFDENGELRNWWTESTLNEFHKRMNCLVEYFNGYEKVDAHFSLNENIADNVGITLAFRAYRKWFRNSTDHWDEFVPLMDYNGEQLFFLAFAQSQCTDDTDTLDDATDYDRHINNKGRVIASLTNLPEFSETFNCPVGSPMNPAKKCVIW